MWLCEDIPRWTGIEEIGGPRYVSGVGQNQVLSCASPAAPASDAVACTGIWVPNWRRLAGTGIAQRALLGTLRGGPCSARTALHCACYVPRWAARRYRSPGAGGLRPRQCHPWGSYTPEVPAPAAQLAHTAQSTQQTAPGHTLPRAPSLLVSSGPPLGVAKSRPDISGTSFPPILRSDGL